MNVRDAIEQRLRKKMMRMREALSRFDDATAEREMVGPTWNVRDLAGHFIFWTREATTHMPNIARGAAQPDYDLDRINAEAYRTNRHMSFVMLLPQLRAAEEDMLAAVRCVMPDTLIDETPIRAWLDTHIEHYDHHWPSLKAATARAFDS